jgi:hypothetical protein
MASGRPVVATRCGGPDELVVDGETGYLVPPRKPQALADAIRSLIDNPDHARFMGQKGQERARLGYDIHQSAEDWSQVLQEAVTTPRKAPSVGTMELLLSVLEEVRPRMLLGRKYRLVSNLSRLLGRPISEV